MKTIKTFYSLLIRSILSFQIIILFASIIPAQNTQKATNEIFTPLNGDTVALDINNIFLPLDNKGVIAHPYIDPIGEGGRYGGYVFLYASGFMLSGYTNGNLWTNGVAYSFLVEDYIPGTYQSGPNDPRATVYVVDANDAPFGQSWQDWRDAVDLGADFYDGDGDGIYNPVDLNNNGQWDPNEDMPDLLGDRTLWCVFNDGLPSNQRRYDDVSPQGIEVRQTVFAYAMSEGSLANTVFIRYRIRNTGLVASQFDSVYFSAWADPDIGQHNDDATGSDTLLQAGYTYNPDSDAQYGDQPPAFLIDQLGGPVVYIPGETFIDNNGNGEYDDGIDTPIDTAKIMRGQYLGMKIFPGAKNLGISSFMQAINSDPVLGDPHNKEEARYYILGLDRDGNVVDPCTFPHGEVRGGVDCSLVNPYYWFSGDPVTDVGWICINQLDVRQMLSVGPFTLKEGEDKEIFLAYIVGQGNSPLDGITVARQWSHDDQIYYDNNFDLTVSEVNNDNTVVTDFQLYQNYPNPFNPSTIIKFSIPVSGNVSLKIYDVLGREISTLVNDYLEKGIYQVNFDASNLSSGIYYYTLQQNNSILSKKMILLK